MDPIVIVARVDIPQSIPRVELVVRLVNGIPALFTADGRYVVGQRALEVEARVESVLACKAEILIGRIEVGLPP